MRKLVYFLLIVSVMFISILLFYYSYNHFFGFGIGSFNQKGDMNNSSIVSGKYLGDVSVRLKIFFDHPPGWVGRADIYVLRETEFIGEFSNLSSGLHGHFGISSGEMITFKSPLIYVGSYWEDGVEKHLYKDITYVVIGLIRYRGKIYFDSKYIVVGPEIDKDFDRTYRIYLDLSNPITKSTCVDLPNPYTYYEHEYTRIARYSIPVNVEGRIHIRYNSVLAAEEKEKYYIYDDAQGCWITTEWYSYQTHIYADYGLYTKKISGPATVDVSIRIKYKASFQYITLDLAREGIIPVDTNSDPLDHLVVSHPMIQPPRNFDSHTYVYEGTTVEIPFGTPINWQFYVSISIPIRFITITLGIRHVKIGNPISLLISVKDLGTNSYVDVGSYSNSKYEKSYSYWVSAGPCTGGEGIKC